MSLRLAPCGFQFASDEAHHDLRPADHGDRAVLAAGAGIGKGRDHADVAAPAHASVIHRDKHLSVGVPSPGRSSLR